MKKSLLFVLSALILSGCIETKDDPAPMCWDIIDSTAGQPNQAILINKCTGETWITLRDTFPLEDGEITPSFTYKWFRVNRYDMENIGAGLKSK